MRRATWGVAGLLALGLTVTACPGRAPLPVAGALAPCPRSPNCVSSQADPADPVHYVAPLALVGDPDTAAQRVADAAQRVDGAGEWRIDGDHVRIVFHTPSGLFTDDVDLLVDRPDAVIQVRSSSRIGYGDMGVNRGRIEAIRAQWAATTPEPE
ncbi:MAG: DUF1499 domain-containing protein [Myxococcota bacterium]